MVGVSSVIETSLEEWMTVQLARRLKLCVGFCETVISVPCMEQTLGSMLMVIYKQITENLRHFRMIEGQAQGMLQKIVHELFFFTHAFSLSTT
jgi:hypothetical protein